MENLKFTDFFGYLPIPESLKGKVLNEKHEPIDLLDNLSRINIFVGPNNTGKSRFLREFIKTPIAPNNYSQNIKNKIHVKTHQIKTDFFTLLQSIVPGIKEMGNWSFHCSKDVTSAEIASLFDSGNLISNLQDQNNKIKAIAELVKSIISIPGLGYNNQSFEVSLSTRHNIGNTLSSYLYGLSEFLDHYIYKYHKYQRIYIPSTRTLRIYAKTANLKNIVAKDYSLNIAPDGNTPYLAGMIEIENGEEFYTIVFSHKNSNHPNRMKIKRFENFLKENFFGGKDVELTSYYTENPAELHIRIGDEKEQPIYMLGDGIQMLIILTYPLFLFENGIIVIEEPELFIHPGMQKKFLDIITNNSIAQNFLFLIATHSNHFIDSMMSSEEISIFTVDKRLDPKDNGDEKLAELIVSNVGFGNNNALSLLGVTNSSVYLANCTIWVEGPTDRMYLAKYIKCYLGDNNPKKDKKYDNIKNFQEGIHYSFVYSAGDTIIHWNFEDEPEEDTANSQIIAKNLCGRALIIVDNDENKNPDRKKHLADTLGMRFYELPVVEVENLLSYEVIKSTIMDYKSCAKIDNMEQPTANDLKNIRLGTLIDNHILKNVTGKRKSFSKKDERKDKSEPANLTLNCKVDFCEKSLQHITYENLTPDAIETVENILDFVLEHNKN